MEISIVGSWKGEFEFTAPARKGTDLVRTSKHVCTLGTLFSMVGYCGGSRSLCWDRAAKTMFHITIATQLATPLWNTDVSCLLHLMSPGFVWEVLRQGVTLASIARAFLLLLWPLIPSHAETRVTHGLRCDGTAVSAFAMHSCMGLAEKGGT